LMLKAYLLHQKASLQVLQAHYDTIQGKINHLFFSLTIIYFLVNRLVLILEHKFVNTKKQLKYRHQQYIKQRYMNLIVLLVLDNLSSVLSQPVFVQFHHLVVVLIQDQKQLMNNKLKKDMKLLYQPMTNQV
jgi:hypothetical protein